MTYEMGGLNITRAKKPHLSFGMGMHYSVWEPLWRDTISFRGLQRLPLTL